MKLKTFPGGVHPPDFKSLSNQAGIEIAAIPQRVIVPLSQHIGAPSKPTVKVGDEVRVGQKIAEPKGFVSIPQHSPVAGKVSAIGLFPHPLGNEQLAIEIEVDTANSEWKPSEDYAEVMELPADELRRRVAEAGICGMGGAGFPSSVKLSPPENKKIDTVILNGVECEPFLTSDHQIMLAKTQEIVTGLKIIMKIVGAKTGYIGIEANKPDAIAKMQECVANEKKIEIVGLKLKYPQGAEKQLIKAAVDRDVPCGGLPMDIGVVVQNVATANAIYEAARWRKPLIERTVTVTGSIVKQPKNFVAKIGTPLVDLINQCGGLTGNARKVIFGGPMMGFTVADLNTPITKGTSGITILSDTEVHADPAKSCIRCARCVDVCPMNLIPTLIAEHSKKGNYDEAEKLGVMDCIKCGSCAYICPARIPLIQRFDLARMEIAKKRKR